MGGLSGNINNSNLDIFEGNKLVKSNNLNVSALENSNTKKIELPGTAQPQDLGSISAYDIKILQRFNKRNQLNQQVQ